jgi:type III secretory pathway lipoprotein EscJ
MREINIAYTKKNPENQNSKINQAPVFIRYNLNIQAVT